MTTTPAPSLPPSADPSPAGTHPRLAMHGPRVGRVASVRLVEPVGALPYASDHRRGRAPVAAAVALLVAGAGVGAVVLNRDDHQAARQQSSRQTGQRPAATTGPATTGPPTTVRSSPATTAPTSRPPATTAAPRPTTSVPAKPAPTAALPEHLAIYRGGKLYMEGALPSRTVADAFVKKASEVIGPQNVVDHYVIDKRAAVPVDGKVRVDEPFLFRANSAEIDPAYTPLLNLGVAVMQLNPQVTMRVVGYTDASGPPGWNMALSQVRAQAVATWLSSHGKIDPSRFVVIGRGSADPVAPNETADGRSKNRRIEVELAGLLRG